MNQKAREHILSWFQAGLAAVEPAKVTRDSLHDVDTGEGKLIVLAVGKAAVAMAFAAREVFGNRIDDGLLVTKQLTEEVDGFVGIQAAHPIPNEESLRAGEYVLELMTDLATTDTVVALVSGGGSSLLECPIEGISLMDMQITTELLMYAGAGIHELNTVRKALSAIKGGGLRRAIGDARCVTLMLSDVIGNDHSVIASGPTVPGPSHRGSAWQVIEDFRIQQQVPETVRQALTTDAPSLPPVDASRDVRRVIADNTTFLAAIEQAAEADGFEVTRRWERWRDDARDLARCIVQECESAGDEIDVLLGGGEATSLVRGDGRGGRNTETALVASVLMANDCDWTIASLASDGDDGNSGAAGAIVDATTVEDRTSAESALQISDSAGYLQLHDALVVTGPTGTNVNDVYIALRNNAISGAQNE